MKTGRDTCNGSCEHAHGCDCAPQAAHAATYIGCDENGPMYSLTWRERIGVALPLLCVVAAVAALAVYARMP